MKKLMTFCALAILAISANAQPGGFGGPGGGFGGGPRMGGMGPGMGMNGNGRTTASDIAPDFRMDPEGYASFAVEVLRSACELTDEQADKIEDLYLKEYNTIRKKLFGIDSPYANGMGRWMPMGMPPGMGPGGFGGQMPEGQRPQEKPVQKTPAQIAEEAVALSEILDHYDTAKAASKLEKQVKKVLTPAQREQYDSVKESYEKRFSFDKFPGLTPLGSMLRPQSWQKPRTEE